jgi:AhpD family alkylhydroperoxidase
MRLLAEWFPQFAEKLDEIDALYREARSIDEKTHQFICFALAIRNRSRPCLLKHFKGALEAGATLKELSEIMALTFRESAGGDDCWTHDALGDVQKLLTENIRCCPK